MVPNNVCIFLFIRYVNVWICVCLILSTWFTLCFDINTLYLVIGRIGWGATGKETIKGLLTIRTIIKVIFLVWCLFSEHKSRLKWRSFSTFFWEIPKTSSMPAGQREWLRSDYAVILSLCSVEFWKRIVEDILKCLYILIKAFFAIVNNTRTVADLHQHFQFRETIINNQCCNFTCAAAWADQTPTAWVTHTHTISAWVCEGGLAMRVCC